MFMTLQQFKYAIAVEREMSFVKAAKISNVSQPSLSNQIKKLENEIGVRIFNRSANSKVSITIEGEKILQRFHKILSSIDSLLDEAKAIDSGPVGELSVGMIPTICPYLLPTLLNTKNKLFPNLTLEVYEEPTEVLVSYLEKGKLDCSIMSTPRKNKSFELIEKPLYYESFLLYASENHPLLSHSEVKFKELSQFPVSILDDAHCISDQILAACNSVNKKSRGESRLVTGGLQSLLSIVDQTETYSLIPALASKFLHFSHPKIGLRVIKDPVPQRKVSLVYNKHYARKKLLKALEECVTQSLPEGAYSKSIGRVLDPLPSRF